jgi:hypothetical protein
VRVRRRGRRWICGGELANHLWQEKAWEEEEGEGTVCALMEPKQDVKRLLWDIAWLVGPGRMGDMGAYVMRSWRASRASG